MASVRRLLALILVFVAPALAAQVVQPIPVPSPPSLGAESYILIDHHSGEVLVEQNADERRDPASLTKLMTAYVVFAELKAGNISMDDMVLVSERAWRAPGSRMFIEVGDRVRVEDLLRGVIIQSGNDASIALAEYVAGTVETFAQVMNQYAEQLGMENTQYRNATGLPHPEHYSTARDTAILARALIRNFPEYYGFYSERSFTWNDITQYNRNELLGRNPAVDGLKTGYTEDAGYCLATSAKQDGMRLISVVMGADSPDARVNQSQALLSYGFRFFSTHRLYAAGEALTRARVWKGLEDTVALGLQDDLYVTIPQRQYDNLEAGLTVDSLITAPISAGTAVGHVTVSLQGEKLAEVPLITLGEVAEGSWWDKVVDEALLLFE
jgi:D-alanyl-D-alanine carboxypeptidase (penicillin-binding protein 5/6)